VTPRKRPSVSDIGAADEDGNCLVIADLPEGSYPSGANGTLTVSRTGERQNTCLPVNALRSDNGGDYVFVLQEKKTVTGLEFTARRVDVEVLDRDSSLVSVQGGIDRDDKVITSASKPITEGGRVRLDES
jgi:multidrug efflux pump subunit AcrA (membrane-fusion protein)